VTRPRSRLARRARRRILATLVGLVLVAAAVPQVTAAADGLAGQSGIQLGLPLTDSAMTINGRGRFQNLSVTVNQTAHLANQAISVTWTGGDPGTNVSSNFLQIFQCWGDDDGTNAENPGPPPEQCEFVENPSSATWRPRSPTGHHRRCTAGSSRTDGDFPGSIATTPTRRVLRQRDRERVATVPPVDGTVVNASFVTRQVTSDGGAAVTWMNNYFDFNTTNEKPWARPTATGPAVSHSRSTPGWRRPAWAAARRSSPDRTAPTRFRSVGSSSSLAGKAPTRTAPPATSETIRAVTSPLSPQVWSNRIAFPLDFNPVDSPCKLGADERRIAGSELATGAVTSWQPKLCANPGSPPYADSAVSDDQARQQVIIGAAGAPGMAVVSRPYDPAFIDPESNPVVYAPLTLSGAVIAFNIERLPQTGHAFDPGEVPITSTRVEHLNLTPRLVAKLLTQSYLSAFYNIQANGARPTGPYGWLTSAPATITVDPDFLRYNPEFAALSTASQRNMATLTVEAPTSDTAQLVWEWILADPEAKAWLDGAPDEWGMKVNPYYATDAAVNVNGAAFADPVPEDFPKNDPYCHQDPGLGGIVPRRSASSTPSPTRRRWPTPPLPPGPRTTGPAPSTTRSTSASRRRTRGGRRRARKSSASDRSPPSPTARRRCDSACRPPASAGRATTVPAARSSRQTTPDSSPA
jgi:hypothetical protein